MKTKMLNNIQIGRNDISDKEDSTMHFGKMRITAGIAVVIAMVFCVGGVFADSAVNDKRNADSTSMDAYEFGYHTGVCDPAETGAPGNDRLYAALERRRAACERGVSDRKRGEAFDSDTARRNASEASR